MIIFLKYVRVPEVGNTADTPNFLGYFNTPLKENLGVPTVKENLTSVGFEPMTSGLDLPMLRYPG